MHPILKRPNRMLKIAATIFMFVAFACPARADIFQWEYINPADPGQGKRQSTMLAPDGAGVDAMPSADLRYRNLTMAYLIGADLRHADFSASTLTDADFSEANLSNANFYGDGTALMGTNFHRANLTNANFLSLTPSLADFTGAEVQGANFGKMPSFDVSVFREFFVGSGITPTQLYSTASYQARDLSGIGLIYNYLAGANLAGQKLTNANFAGATLTGVDFKGANLANASFDGADLTVADFTDARIDGASFYIGSCAGDCVTFVNAPPPGSGIALGQLYSTANYQIHDLRGIDLTYNFLAGGDFTGQNLTNANFDVAYLTDADFTGAEVQGANFGSYLSFYDRATGITLAQLYSTASYQAHALSGINLTANSLAGGNFSGQNLTNASFEYATLTDADFRHSNLTNTSFVNASLRGVDLTSADTRGAVGLNLSGVTTTTTNLIRSNGHIDGLDLDAGGLLVVRDYDGDSRYEPASPPVPITVDEHLAMGPGGTLRMVFEADAWNSTISFAPGISVTLGGALELTFATDVNIADQVGRTFDLFDWTGVNPTGSFAVSSPYTWDLSNLYTTGEATLTSVPEPAGFALAAVGAFSLTFYCRRIIP